MAILKQNVIGYISVAILCLQAATAQPPFECSSSMNLTDMCPLLISVYATVEERTTYIKQLVELASKVETLEEKVKQLETITERKDEDLVKTCASIQALCKNGGGGGGGSGGGSGGQRVPDDVGCGSPVIQAPPAIERSEDTVAGEWPWTVSLAIPAGDGASMQVSCNGVLLDKRTVLTPASCVKGHQKRTIQFGIYYKWSGDKYPVEARRNYQILIHPDYNEATNENNIALLKLDSDLQYTDKILPICLPTPETTSVNLVPGNGGIVSGWQFTDEQAIRKTKVYVQSKEVCLKSKFEIPARGRIGPDQFCTKWMHRWFWNGSPLVFRNPQTGRYVLEGLVSHFLGHDGEKLYEVFVKVAHFVDWIEANRKA